MPSECCIAADLGAGSGRVIAGQITGDRLSLSEVNRFQTSCRKSAKTGYLCWAIDEIEAEIRRGIDAAVSQFRVSSIGVDSWAVDFVLLDEALHRVGEAVCYRDGRTEGMAGRVTAQIPAAEIYRLTGIQFLPFNTLYQLAATTAREPEWTKRAHHLLMIPDYLHYRLTGRLSSEYTNATTTQMLALDGNWAPQLFAAAGLPQIWMPSPVPAGSKLGETRIGNTSIPVVASATHDTASAVAGTPFEGPDEAFISSGTWSLMGIESTTPFTSDRAMQWNFSNEGGFGRRFRVLKNIMGLWLLQRVLKELEIEIGDGILAAAAESPAWRSIVNPDDPRFLNPPSMTEAIRQFCRETHQPEPESAAEFVLCTLNSLALSYRMVKEQLEALRGKPLSRIRIVGGGSRNRLLNQLCADSCRLPVSAGPVEATAAGNISVQMIALGKLRGIEEARALIRHSFAMDEFEPQHEVPGEVWARFQQYLAGTNREKVQ